MMIFNFLIFLLRVSVLPSCMAVCHVFLVPVETRRENWTPLSWNYDGCGQLPFGSWQLNPVPLKEDPGLSTSEPSLQLSQFYLTHRLHKEESVNDQGELSLFMSRINKAGTSPQKLGTNSHEHQQMEKAGKSKVCVFRSFWDPLLSQV